MCACSVGRWCTTSGFGTDAGAWRGSARAGVDAFEERFHAVDDVVVLEPAGGGDDDVGRAVALAEEARDVVTSERGDRVGVAEHLPTERVVREHSVSQQRVHLVVGRVLVQCELFEDDLALGFDLVPAQRRAR